MFFNNTVFANEAMMLAAIFGDYLLWMCVTKDQLLLEFCLNLLFSIFVCTKFDWFHAFLARAMIRVTERAIELAFKDLFFIFAFYHVIFDALTAGSLSATNQVDRLSAFEIEEMFAQWTLEVLCICFFHI
jgi:hypothetical protein